MFISDDVLHRHHHVVEDQLGGLRAPEAHLDEFLGDWKPGVLVSTRNAVMPLLPRSGWLLA